MSHSNFSFSIYYPTRRSTARRLTTLRGQRKNAPGPVSLACSKVHEVQHRSPYEPKPASKCMRMVVFRTIPGIIPRKRIRMELVITHSHGKFYLNPSVTAIGQFNDQNAHATFTYLHILISTFNLGTQPTHSCNANQYA